MIYHSTHSDEYLWYLILRGKKALFFLIFVVTDDICGTWFCVEKSIVLPYFLVDYNWMLGQTIFIELELNLIWCCFLDAFN